MATGVTGREGLVKTEEENGVREKRTDGVTRGVQTPPKKDGGEGLERWGVGVA